MPDGSIVRFENLERLFQAGARPLPHYRSHKIVQALKLAAVEVNGDGSARVVPTDSHFSPFDVKVPWGRVRFNASLEDPGYYVLYPDGYESWSPTEAFESGYTRIEEGS